MFCKVSVIYFLVVSLRFAFVSPALAQEPNDHGSRARFSIRYFLAVQA